MSARVTIAALLLSVSMLPASSASAFDWTYLSMDGENCTCIESDPVHGRIFVGTLEGFHYLEQSTGVWTDRDWDGWIGRTVWSIDWHPDLDERVITGRENAWFKGYIELSDDLGASEEVVYESNGGAVSALAHDDFHHYACTWPDIAPGEFLRSGDGGETWTLLGPTGQYAMSAMSISMMTGEVFLGGDNRVVRSWDSGETWDFIGDGLPVGQIIHDLDWGHVGGDVAFEVSHWACTDIGLYFAYSPNQWLLVYPQGCRAIDSFRSSTSWPHPPDYVAIVASDGHLHFSSNFGASWTDQTGNLPGVAVDVVYSPYDRGLYVCTAQHGIWYRPNIVTAVGEAPAAEAVALHAWPNPFNPKTKLSFALDEAGPVELAVYDVGGKRVATLLDGWREAGPQELSWNAEGLPSGVYLARLSGGFGARSLQLVILK